MLLADEVGFGVVRRFAPERDGALDVGVVPAARRRGVGSMLYERLLAHAQAQGGVPRRALDDNDVVGWAQLNVYPRVGHHAFTVVARSHRGRGIPRALETELIHRARRRGLERLIANSNVDNVPMRTLNAELGYRPAPTRVYARRRLEAAPTDVVASAPANESGGRS